MIKKGKKSRIWRIPQEDFCNLVLSAESIVDILRKLGMSISGSSHQTVKDRITHDKIDCSHMRTIQNLRVKALSKEALIPLENILIENSSYNRIGLKKRLLGIGMLKNRCYKCGLGTEWNGELISLQIDHINGINNDNRIENLRILCPNCHSQTKTFGSKRLKKSIPCPLCGGHKKSKQSRSCIKCKKRQTKVDLPDLNLVWEDSKKQGYEAVGRKYGISGNAIKKRFKTAGFNLFPRRSANGTCKIKALVV